MQAVEAKSLLREGGFLLFGAFSGNYLAGLGIGRFRGGSLVIGGRCRLLPPALELLEPVTVAVQFQDMDVVGETVEQRAGEAFGAEDGCPFLERQVGGDQHRTTLVTLAEDLEQKLGAGRGERHIAELIDDQQLTLNKYELSDRGLKLHGIHPPPTPLIGKRSA
jgi:hypothetical protein